MQLGARKLFVSTAAPHKGKSNPSIIASSCCWPSTDKPSEIHLLSVRPSLSVSHSLTQVSICGDNVSPSVASTRYVEYKYKESGGKKPFDWGRGRTPGDGFSGVEPNKERMPLLLLPGIQFSDGPSIYPFVWLGCLFISSIHRNNSAMDT